MGTALVPCPNCGAEPKYIHKSSIRCLAGGLKKQEWLCRKCDHRFRTEYDTSGKQVDLGSSKVLLQYERNLDAPQPKLDLRNDHQLQEGKISEFAWKMNIEGLKEKTITNRKFQLRKLVRLGADLTNPESVKTILATEKFTVAARFDSARAYKAFAATFNISWKPPKVTYQPALPFIPLETEIDQLIAACSRTCSTFLSIEKDTGARAGEVNGLKWTDWDFEHDTVSINRPEKGSLPRVIKVTPKTIAMVKALPKNHGDYLFNHYGIWIRHSFERTRKKLAENLQNLRLRRITFLTFRHWKGTMEYAKTRDILHVKYILGHKRVQSTEIYTHLVNFESDEWTVRRPKSREEEDALIESGFIYIRFDEKDGCPIYKKRK